MNALNEIGTPETGTSAACEALCWINGQVIPAGEARVSVMDHGLLYGDGVFEGLRFYNGKVFKMREHLQRLVDSAKVLNLEVPLSVAEMAAAIDTLVAQAPWPHGYLRLVVTRGVGPMGLDPRPCHSPELFIVADQLSLVSEESRNRGAKVIIASTRRLPLDGLDPRVKSLNYLNHIMARMEANIAGADEAILLNQQGRVAEGSADNVFIVRDGVLRTPPVTEGALAGITRATLLELAAALGIAVREEPLSTFDLYTADECFLTGTGAELIPVAEVDGRKLSKCPGEIYCRLSYAYRQLVLGEVAAS